MQNKQVIDEIFKSIDNIAGKKIEESKFSYVEAGTVISSEVLGDGGYKVSAMGKEVRAYALNSRRYHEGDVVLLIVPNRTLSGKTYIMGAPTSLYGGEMVDKKDPIIGMEDDITELKKLDSIKQIAIGDLEISQDVLDNKFAEAEGKLEGLEGDVSLVKANVEVQDGKINATVEEVGRFAGQIQANTSKIEQTAKDVSISFESTGGSNLIRNGEAKNNTLFWTGSITVERDLFSGYGNLLVSTFPDGFHGEEIELKNDTNYVYQAMIATQNPILEGNLTPLFYYATSEKNGTGTAQSTLITQSQKTTNISTLNKCYIHFKTAATGKVYFRGYVKGAIGSTGQVKATQIMLSESTYPVPYNQHLSEMYDGIIKMDKNGIQVGATNSSTTTQMDAQGFKIWKNGEANPVFKVDSNGLYLQGNVDITNTLRAEKLKGGILASNLLNADSKPMTEMDLDKGTLRMGSLTGGNFFNWDGSLLTIKGAMKLTSGSSVPGGVIDDGTLTAEKIVAKSITADQIKAGTITADSGILAEASITNAVIQNASIHGAKIENASITSLQVKELVGDKIVANTITGDKIKAGELDVEGNLTVGGTIEAKHIAFETIQGKNIKAETIEGTNIKGETIEGEHIKGGTITGDQIFAGEIDVEGNLTVGGTIEGKHIKGGTIVGDNIVGGTITGTHISGQTITGGHITGNTITGNHIQAGNIDVDGNLTVEGTIEGKHIKANTIVGDNIGAKTISADNIKAGTITGDLIQAGQIDVDGNITAQGTITGEHIQSNSLVSGHITAGAVDASHIKSGAIAAGHIQVGALTSDKMVIANAFIKDAMIANITASKITAGTVDTSKVSISSPNGGIVIADATQQFKDKNGKVRIQMGQDAQQNFSFGIFDETGSGLIMDHSGIKEKAVADGFIKDKMIGSGEIGGDKVNMSSLITEMNSDTNTELLKASKVAIDLTNQSLEVSFSEMKTSIDSNKVEIDDINSQKMYRVEIVSDNGNIFQNGNIRATLRAIVYSWDNDVTNTIDANRFKWTRISADVQGDNAWNQANAGGKKQISVTSADVMRRATFQVDVLDENGRSLLK